MAGLPLTAAAATVDLTPRAGLPLGGYLLREGKTASGAHDPLEGTLVWIRDAAGGEVLWCAIDAVAVDDELASRVASAVSEACGCSTDAVLACATHTHSAAAGWVRSLGPMLPETADPALRDALVQRLADAARGLPATLRPCRPLVAEGRAPGAGRNRNDPRGPHDASVGTLALVDGAGRVVVGVVDYASHATVLGHENLAWSADWPGAARRALAGGLQPLAPFAPRGEAQALVEARPPTIALLQGAAGDASPRFVRRGQTFAEVDRIGALVASAGMDALLQGQPEDRPVRVAVRRGSVSIPTRSLPDVGDARRRAEELDSAWRQAHEAGVPAPEERIARTRYEGALMLVALAEAGLPSVMEVPMAAVAIGEAAWIHLPVELFASFGLAIRKRSPRAWTRVIGYTDGYFGYVADAEAHRNGVYEAFASRFDPEGGQMMTDAAVDLLGRLAGDLGVAEGVALERVPG